MTLAELKLAVGHHLLLGLTPRAGHTHHVVDGRQGLEDHDVQVAVVPAVLPHQHQAQGVTGSIPTGSRHVMATATLQANPTVLIVQCSAQWENTRAGPEYPECCLNFVW